MAMMVSGVILTAVVTLSWALGNYNNEGDGLVSLAANGRYVVPAITRDVRGAQAMTVSSKGALILWLGDFNDDGRIGSNEIVVYYKPSREAVLRRLSSTVGYDCGAISPAALQAVAAAQDNGTLLLTAESMGLSMQNDIVCRNVNSATFCANRSLPQALSVELLISLSTAQNVVENSGRTVELTLYGSATMRVPYQEAGFDPKT